MLILGQVLILGIHILVANVSREQMNDEQTIWNVVGLYEYWNMTFPTETTTM